MLLLNTLSINIFKKYFQNAFISRANGEICEYSLLMSL